MWHIWQQREMHTVFLYKNVKERDHLENVGIDGRMILKWILNEKD
jgi:hypothetical protein